jgi:predicted nuclease with TOPRIM domain
LADISADKVTKSEAEIEADEAIDTFDELVRQRDELRADNKALQDQAFDLTERLLQCSAESERLIRIYTNLSQRFDLVTADDNKLAIENKRLRAEVERVQANHVTVAEEIQRRHDACAPLTAEIERLRAALQEVVAVSSMSQLPDRLVDIVTNAVGNNCP